MNVIKLFKQTYIIDLENNEETTHKRGCLGYTNIWMATVITRVMSSALYRHPGSHCFYSVLNEFIPDVITLSAVLIAKPAHANSRIWFKDWHTRWF